MASVQPQLQFGKQKVLQNQKSESIKECLKSADFIIEENSTYSWLSNNIRKQQRSFIFLNILITIISFVMLTKRNQADRFSKALTKLTSTSQKSQTQKSNQTSFLQDTSMRSDKSTKYGSQIDSKTVTHIDQPRALKMLMEQPEVLINRQVVKLRTEFIPTSNGMLIVILVGQTLINLSWLHSVQQLQPGKILLLYYDLRCLGQGKAKMQSLIIEAGRTQGTALCAALTLIHSKYHDDEVEKVYHFLC